VYLCVDERNLIGNLLPIGCNHRHLATLWFHALAILLTHYKDNFNYLLNIMKKHFYLALAAFAAVFTLSSCNDDESSNNSSDSKDYVITQFDNEPWLGETYISDYDYAVGNQFLIDRYKADASGGCSSFRNGDYIARNLDWFVRDYAVLVVHTPANKAKNRFASVGIVSSNPFVNREMIASGVVNDEVSKGETTVKNWRNILPIFTTDGINEKGVCASVNIVMHEDGARDGYVPCTGSKNPTGTTTSFVSLVRYILDNCESTEDAIKKVRGLRVIQAEKGALAAEDNHIFVSDNDQTVVLEWYNDSMVVNKYPRSNGFRDEHHMPAIMTNFYNCIGTKYTDDNGVIDTEKMLEEHPYAMGVERYETLRQGWEQVNSLESAKELIKKVNYSNYFNLANKWYTENGMYCKRYNGKWYYPAGYPAVSENYAPVGSVWEAIQKMFEPGGYQQGCIDVFQNLDFQMSQLKSGIDREDDWYTELTSVYDIPNKELHVMPQEGWFNNKFYKFTVKGNR